MFPAIDYQNRFNTLRPVNFSVRKTDEKNSAKAEFTDIKANEIREHLRKKMHGITRPLNSKVMNLMSQQNSQAAQLMDQKKYKEALAILERLPDFVPVLLNRALCHIHLKQNSIAHDLLDDILEKSPTHTNAVHAKSTLLMNEGRFFAALQIVQAYENKGGKYPELLERISDLTEKIRQSRNVLMPQLRTILENLKKEMTSSHDIIDQFTLTNLESDNAAPKEFGLENYRRYLVHLVKLKSIERAFSDPSLASFEKSCGASFNSVSVLAMAFMSVGECQVVRERMQYEIIKAEIPCLAIQYHFHAGQIITRKADTHALLVIAPPSVKCAWEIEKISDFSKFPDTVILVDPFFNIIAPVNQMPQRLNDFLQTKTPIFHTKEIQCFEIKKEQKSLI